MSNVYIIQDSPGKNFDPAREYGELIVMLTGHETPSEVITKLEHYLQNFQSDDYLLLVGNPATIARAAIITWDLSMLETVKLLVWDREHYKYNVERISI
jgi:hypothetical protein